MIAQSKMADPLLGLSSNVRRNVGSVGGGGASITTTILFVLAAFFLVGGVLYWWFRPRPHHATVMGPWSLKGVTASASGSSQETILDSSQLLKTMGNNFTLSFFVYMDEVNAERIPIAGPAGDYRFKPLVYILGVGTVVVDPLHQKALVQIQPLTDRARVNAPVTIEVDNFVVARWNQLTLCVEGRSADVYLNGRLIKSALMENVPALQPVGLLLETIPDFSGTAALFQAWPRRLTGGEVQRNYKQNTDLRGRPAIPSPGVQWAEVWDNLKGQLCKVGFCGFKYDVGPLQYVDYDFA
jgi:hypothetical protein